MRYLPLAGNLSQPAPAPRVLHCCYPFLCVQSPSMEGAATEACSFKPTCFFPAGKEQGQLLCGGNWTLNKACASKSQVVTFLHAGTALCTLVDVTHRQEAQAKCCREAETCAIEWPLEVAIPTIWQITEWACSSQLLLGCCPSFFPGERGHTLAGGGRGPGINAFQAWPRTTAAPSSTLNTQKKAQGNTW